MALSHQVYVEDEENQNDDSQTKEEQMDRVEELGDRGIGKVKKKGQVSREGREE